MSGFLLLAMVAAVLLGVCLVGLSVVVLVRRKPLRSCGCASITFGGETLRCPGCTSSEPCDREPDEAATPSARDRTGSEPQIHR